MLLLFFIFYSLNKVQSLPDQPLFASQCDLGTLASRNIMMQISLPSVPQEPLKLELVTPAQHNPLLLQAEELIHESHQVGWYH